MARFFCNNRLKAGLGAIKVVSALFLLVTVAILRGARFLRIRGPFLFINQITHLAPKMENIMIPFFALTILGGVNEMSFAGNKATIAIRYRVIINSKGEASAVKCNMNSQAQSMIPSDPNISSDVSPFNSQTNKVDYKISVNSRVDQQSGQKVILLTLVDKK